MDEYPRADGKVVHLGQEIEAPHSELILYRDMSLVPMRGVECPLCGSIVDITGTPKHSAWHRKLDALTRRVENLL